MTKLQTIITAAVLAFAGAAETAAQESFTITGSFSQLSDSMRVVLTNVEGQEPKKIAETMLIGGKFTLTGSVKSPTMCELHIQKYIEKRKGYGDVFDEIRMMMENTAYSVASDQNREALRKVRNMNLAVKVSGGQAQNQLDEYLREINEVEQKARQIGYKGAEMYFASNGNPDTIRKYDILEKKANDELMAAKKAFIAKHPDYHISAHLIGKELIKPFEYTAAECRDMAESVKACPDTARLNQIERRLNVMLKYCLSNKFTDFAVTTTDNQVKHLSDYVQPGKYTFIDFWASWCGPCRAAIPHVRELYKKYAGKLNVLSISLDEKEPAWRKAMEQEKMEWTQLWLAKDQMEPAAQAYYITSIPRLILLNADGEIVVSTYKPDAMSDYLEMKNEE